MADGKSNRGTRDGSRISLGEDYEVEYWTKKFGVSPDGLKDAIAEAGTNSGQAVADYLGKRL